MFGFGAWVCWRSLVDVWVGDIGECRDTGRNRRVGAGAVGGGEGDFSSIVDELPPIPGIGVRGGQLRGSDKGRRHIPRAVVAARRGRGN